MADDVEPQDEPAEAAASTPVDTSEPDAGESEDTAPVAAPQQAAPAPAAPQGGGGLTPFQQEMADHWHGKGMSLAGIAGILGGTHYESEGSGGYDAQNPTSGASGAYQYLGSRAEQEAAFAKSRGLDPWDHTAQNEFASSEIMPNGPEWDTTGKYMWQAQDPNLAGRTWVNNFERPGNNAEAVAAGRKAQELYPLLQARYASGAPGTQIASAGASDATPDIAIGDSIAAGVAQHAGFKQSLNPNNNNSAGDMSVAAANSRTTAQTLQYIQAHAQELSGQNVILSSGMSNDLGGGQGPAGQGFGQALANTKAQIDALKAAGANPVLLGVGSGVRGYQQANDMLAKLAQENGVPFSGELATTQGGRVHPSDYGAVLAQAKFGPAPGAAPAAGPTQPTPDTTAMQATLAEFQKHMATPVGAGKFDGTKLGPNVPQPKLPTTLDGTLALFNQTMASPKARQAAGVEQQTPGWNWGGLGTALGDFVRGIPAGVTNFLGMPADMVNSANHYYAQHPQDAMQVGLGPEAGTAAYFDKDLLTPRPAAPNAKAPYIPLGAQDLQKDAKYYAPWLDMSQHGTGVLSDVLTDMGQFVGAGVNPAGIGRDAASLLANPKTSTALGALLHHVLMPAAASGGLDLGKWVGGEGLNSAEQHGWISQGTADALGIASRIGLGLATVGALHKAGEGREAVAAATSPEGQMNRVFQSSYPSTGGAAEKEAANQEIANFNPNSVAPGYQVPAGFRTSNLPLIQFAQDVTKRDAELNGRDEANRAAILAMRPEGDAEDAMTALTNSQKAQQTLIDQRLEQALTHAQQTQEIAQAGSQGALPWGGGPGASSELDLANNVRSELRMARDDSKAYTDNQWDVAREQGYTTANATLGNTYPEIEGLIADNVRGGVNFPWDVVRPLYKNDPRSMFDELGVRQPGVDAGRLYTDDNTSVDQWHQVQSNIGNEIGMEQDRIGSPGSSGNPQRLRYLTQLYGIATQALEQSAANMDNPYALTRAIQASAIHHGNFVTGGIGRVLNGDDAANAANDLRTFLGNSQKATLGAQALQTAVDQRTGTAALRAGDSTMAPAALQKNMWNGIADWMRQSYINLAANNSRGVAKTWLQNMAGAFDQLKGNPVFDTLRDQLTQHAASADSQVLGNIAQQAAKQSKEEIQKNAAAVVLNGAGPTRLDTVFKADPGAQRKLMAGLVQDAVTGDPTLQGFRGLQRLMWDRVMLAAEGGNINQGGVKDWSFARAKDFVDQSKPAFDVMRQADPTFGANMDRLLNTLVIEDRKRIGTGVQLPPGMTPPKRGPMGLAGDAATRLFQIAFSRMVAPFIEGSGMANSMQAVGQASAYARNIAHTTPQWFQRLANRVDPVSRGRQAIEDALMDSTEGGDKLRGLLAPVTGPSGQKWATGIEPWLKASGVMLPQGWMDQARQPGGPLSPPE